MKTILAILVLGMGCHLAKAEDAKTAAMQKEHCEQYLALRSSARTTQRQVEASNWCFAYLRGMKDVMDGDLAWSDDLHKQVVVGVWSDGVSLDQLIRVFVNYAKGNPEKLNQSAFAVFRQSVEAAGLYTYAPADPQK